LNSNQGYIGQKQKSNISNEFESQGNAQAFNLNEAFLQTGGFGMFQWVALILLTFVRNYGMH
jgi:hypothetical protein